MLAKHKIRDNWKTFYIKVLILFIEATDIKNKIRMKKKQN